MNLAATAGAFLTAVGVAIVLLNLVRSARKGERAGTNPWNAATLEWATASPPAPYNFAELPVVRGRLPLWEDPEPVERAARAEPAEPIHMPRASYWPLVTAVGVLTTFALFLAMERFWWAPLAGLVVVAVGILSWAFEPAH
jgi:cytochrome c oxidase subunit I+III